MDFKSPINSLTALFTYLYQKKNSQKRFAMFQTTSLSEIANNKN